MTARLSPPALRLPDQAAVRWNSFIKILRQPERNWPAQILERPIIASQVGNGHFALIADPAAAQTIMTGAQGQFPRWRIYQRVFAAGIGRHGLSLVEGAQWRRQRRAFSPMFRPESAVQFVPLFQSTAARAVANWNASGETICIPDIVLEMTRLTLGATWQALFGPGLAGEPLPIVGQAAAEIHAAQLRGDANIVAANLGELADAAARRGPLRGIAPHNPFDHWGNASKHASGNRPPSDLTEQELCDNARNFLGAGHETTALALSWALWLVAQDADTQHRIHDELDHVVGEAPIDFAATERLNFTGRVISETMRLFPPALLSVRQATDEVTLAGESLPRRTVLAVCIYALHRHRDWWREPDLFWPDRFIAGDPAHRYAYLPFGAGPRACIGAAVARLETITVLATILQQFQVSTDPPVPVRPQMLITLRPDRPLPIVLHRRR